VGSAHRCAIGGTGRKMVRPEDAANPHGTARLGGLDQALALRTVMLAATPTALWPMTGVASVTSPFPQPPTSALRPEPTTVNPTDSVNRWWMPCTLASGRGQAAELAICRARSSSTWRAPIAHYPAIGSGRHQLARYGKSGQSWWLSDVALTCPPKGGALQSVRNSDPT